jgi:hypothetical protein
MPKINDNVSKLITFGCLVLIGGMATAKAEQPFFQTLVLAPSTTQDWILNAYRVLDQLPNGRLLCVFAAEKK